MHSKLLILLIVVPSLLIASPFTLKKSEKKEVISEGQKQKYAQTCGEIIETFPQVLHALADTHVQVTHAIKAFVENDVSFCAKTSKEDFDQCLAKAEQVAKQMKQMQKDLQAFTQIVHKITA